MYIAPIHLTLKDGRTAVLRSPTAKDAWGVNALHRVCASETDFLLMEPGEPELSPAERAAILQRAADSAHICMLLCLVEDRVVGCCRLSVTPRRKIAHRGEVVIFLASEIWGQGVGSAMFRNLFELARSMDLTQLELGFVEGNDRGRALYEKMGFIPYGRLPKAFRLRNGEFRDEILMVKGL